MQTRHNLLRRLLLTSVLCLVTAVAVVVVFSAMRLRSEALLNSREQLVSNAESHAVEIQTLIQGALNTADSVAQILARIKADQDRLEIGRPEIRAILSSVLQAHSELSAVYSAWEPEALDGLDAANRNQPGSDASGRVLVYLQREGNELKLATLSGTDDERLNAWYTTPRKTGQRGVFGPLERQKNGQACGSVVTAVAPIKKGDKFLGLVGVDLSLESLRGTVAQIQLYDGTAKASLWRLDGSLVAGEASRQAVHLQTVRQSKAALSLEAAGQAVALAPLRWLGQDPEWCLLIEVPGAKITGRATRATLLLLFIGVAGAGLGAVWLGWRIQAVQRVVKGVVCGLESGSQTVDDASNQLNRASQSLAEGANHQAASLEETSASLEEMASMTQRNASNAESAKALANQTRQTAEQGAHDMRAMSEAMAAIQTASNNISKIIKTIDEIAFQTNLLALNAAVEAARAGEAGLGFAVVADEVRALAQRCSQAARETTAKIEDCLSKSQRGVEINDQVAQSLASMVDKARQVDELVAEISSACQEQERGIGQLNVAVTQIDQITQSNAANAEQSASASNDLRFQAQTLRQTIAELTDLVGGDHRQAARLAGEPKSEDSHPTAPEHLHAESSQSKPSSRSARLRAVKPQPVNLNLF